MSAVPENHPLRIRMMGYEDVAAVMAIENCAYPFPWTEAIVRDCLRVGYQCRVLESDGHLEAYGIMSIGANEAHILNLCVRAESRRLGLARQMLEHLLALARTRAVQTIFLEVRPSNLRAVRLYLKAGFCEIGLRRGYYPAERGREDALVMAKELHRSRSELD